MEALGGSWLQRDQVSKSILILHMCFWIQGVRRTHESRKSAMMGHDHYFDDEFIACIESKDELD